MASVLLGFPIININEMQLTILRLHLPCPLIRSKLVTHSKLIVYKAMRNLWAFIGIQICGSTKPLKPKTLQAFQPSSNCLLSRVYIKKYSQRPLKSKKILNHWAKSQTLLITILSSRSIPNKS